MNKSFSVVIALVCGTLATVVASQWLNANDEGNGVELADIFVAISAIDVGDEIKPEKIKLEKWPADRVPAGSTGDLKLLEGKFAKQRFYEGEAIMPVKLMDDNWTEVPKSYRVVAMNASESGISNLIQPGDRVDVTAFFDKNDLIPQSTTKTVLSGIRVYALDGDTQRRTGGEKAKNIRNIQLLIHESETTAWELANRLGSVSLFVSSDADNTDGRNDAGKDFTTWLTDLQDRRDETANQKDSFENFRRTASTTATTPTVVAPVRQKAEGHKMIMMSGDQIVEYWIPSDGESPRMLSGSDTDDMFQDSDASEAAAPAEKSDGPTETNQYSYLNGAGSPFYQSAGGR